MNLISISIAYLHVPMQKISIASICDFVCRAYLISHR